MTINEFYSLCAQVKVDNPFLRIGQTYCTILAVVDSKLADKIRGTAFHCYYDNAKIPEFFVWLSENWNDQGEHWQNAKKSSNFKLIEKYLPEGE